MRLILAAALGIGLFALAGLALQLVLFTLVALYKMPIDIYKHYKNKQRDEKLREMKAEAIRAITKMAAENFLDKEFKENSDKAYKSAVKKVSRKKDSK